MPPDLRNTTVRHSASSIKLLSDVDYSYPNDMDLSPGSELHDKFVNMVYERAWESYNVMSSRHSSWEKINRNLTAYVPLDVVEQKIKDADDRKPVRIIIPRSYAILETLLTYWMAAFGERPYFRYEGVGPEDVLGAMLLELHIDKQMLRTKALLPIHTMWRDSFTAGIGIVAINFERKTKRIRTQDSSNVWNSITNKFREVLGSEYEEEIPIFEGNILSSIDPFNYLPDVNVPIQDVQKGEYVGWLDQTNYVTLLSAEKENADSYFNVRYLQDINDGKSTIFSNTRYGQGTGRTDRYNAAEPSQNLARPIDVIRMPIKLIPDEHGLGDSPYPEKWMFSVAADNVLIQAEPMNYEHDEFPVAVCAPDYDGHTTCPISRLEVVYGLQESIDFLVSSHIENIRKSVNNMFVIDPEIVNINDFVESKGGLLARIRRKYWGQVGAVDKAVKQLTVNDITRNNYQDISIMSDIMRDSTAATDSLAGMFRKGGERVTATESRGTRFSALSRLEKAAKITSIQAHQDIAHQCASNVVQLTDGEYMTRIHGRNAVELAELLGKDVGDRVPLTPKDINIAYDIMEGDSSIPASTDADMLIRAIQAVSGFPEAQAVLDIPRIIQLIARASGIKNIKDLIRRDVRPAVTDDENVDEETRKGNIVPIGELENATK